MKILTVFTILAFGAVLIFFVSTGGAMMGSGMMGGGGFGYGMGQGMMGYGNWGNGGSWMNPGYGNNRQMGPGYGNSYNRPYQNNYYGHNGWGKALNKEDAESIVRNYIGGNPNLKPGKITEKDNYFETDIRTKDNSLVTRLSIDKNTGRVQELY